MSDLLGDDVRTIVWDLDGTILNSIEISHTIFSQVLPRHGFAAPSMELLATHYHGTIRDTAIGLISERVDKAIVDRVITDFYELDNAAITHVDEHLFGDAVDLVERAHAAGKRQIIVTNRAHGTERANASPRTMVQNSPSLNGRINNIVCGDDSEHRKPRREVLQHLIADGLSTEGLVVIGDQFVDAEFARNLGVRAFLIDREGRCVPHLERLAGGWESHVTVVRSLADVRVE
jgi:phosphoglycolate phosphatase-like HAD superfamily hydrolase